MNEEILDIKSGDKIVFMPELKTVLSAYITMIGKPMAHASIVELYDISNDNFWWWIWCDGEMIKMQMPPNSLLISAPIEHTLKNAEIVRRETRKLPNLQACINQGYLVAEVNREVSHAPG